MGFPFLSPENCSLQKNTLDLRFVTYERNACYNELKNTELIKISQKIAQKPSVKSLLISSGDVAASYLLFP